MLLTRRILKDVNNSLASFPVVAIVGPRQVGKTTLAKQIISNFTKPAVYLDLELPSDLYKLTSAELFLSQHSNKLVVIDEIQHKKDLYPIIRALVDQKPDSGRFLLLGSASPDLIRHSSESLAGRIAYLRLFPFDIGEIPEGVSQFDLWIKGGFPKALLAENENISWQWKENFIKTYLNRDLIQLGLNISPSMIRNLWMMLAHLNGQLLNVSSIARSLGITSPTVKKYVNFLEDAFLCKSIQAFSWNMSKRLVKAPKIYLNDTGILHQLLGISDFESLSGNPVIGNSWEAFALNQVNALKNEEINLWFYRTHQGAEADMVFTRGLDIIAVAEIKYSDSPQLTRGNLQAFADLNAPENFVITPSSDDYLYKKEIRICSLKDFVFHYLPDL